MKFIEEVVVEEFLPTFRSMLAEALRERGFTQSEVADALGISQSAVSKYAHGEVSRNDALLGDERLETLVERIAEGFDDGGMSGVQALVETEVLIRKMEARGDTLATLHEEAVPDLAAHGGDFRVHDPESELRNRERVLSSVRRGLRRLERASGFAGLIPNVGTNLVECLPDAAGVEDVAGVPGRVFDVKGRAEIPADPEFGASGHVAALLLAARAAGSDARAALNLRYDPELLAALEAAGYTTAEFDAEYDSLEGALAAAFAGASGVSTPDGSPPAVDVVYQTGAHGVEPIVYVLAADAESAAAVARDLL
jgi:predicted fused transcriptional regulator/phosphomethylpyrimidine kinase/predicted transcriptional regulator